MRQAILTLAATVILAAPASALECVGGIPLETKVKRTEIVLLGRIDAVQLHTETDGFAGHALVTVTVKELWKGTTPGVIELRQMFVAGGLRLWEEIGKDYVLFLNRVTRTSGLPPSLSGSLAADECNSKPAAQVDVKALGRSRAPEL